MSDEKSKKIPADRSDWVEHLRRVAEPVLEAAAAGELRKRMPVEKHSQAAVREKVTHLEAVGRCLSGIAPWLELDNPTDGPEKALQEKFRDLARKTILSVTNKKSPDYCNFTEYGQPLVDAAFLSQALVRAPKQLVGELTEKARYDVVQALKSTRAIAPAFNNWLLYPAMIEAALHRLGAKWDPLRVEYAIRQHEQWYRGDGMYSNGPVFQCDYYNSFVIQPMLLDTLREVGAVREWISPEYPKVVIKRAQRHAQILERLISPEGTFPPIGRSLAYRTAVLHLPALLALRGQLPRELKPGQLRSAMTAVLNRMMNMPGTYDEAGWLKIGFCGSQSGIGENNISTGSLYLCSNILLPLGAAEEEPFWSARPEDWTAKRLWSGKHAPLDKALPDQQFIQ